MHDVSAVTPTTIQSVGIEGHVMASTPRPEPHNMPFTSNVGPVSILPLGPEQVSLRSLIDLQTRMLRLLPNFPTNVQTRQEIIEQIQLCEMSLLESVVPARDQQVKLFYFFIISFVMFRIIILEMKNSFIF